MARVRIIDLQPQPDDGADARDDVIGAIARIFCPHCHGRLDGLQLVDLRPIATVGWRGVGRKPLTFETKCRSCNHVLVVGVSKHGASVGSTENAAATLAAERDRDRDLIQTRVDPRYR